MADVKQFWLSVERPGGMMDINSLHLSPKAAAKRDPDRFLELADEVEQIARQIRAKRAQMEMEL